MKDYYDEIFNTVTRIGEERLNRKRRILCRIRNASIALSGIAAVFIIGLGIIKNDSIKNAATKFPKAEEIITENTTTVPVTAETNIVTNTDTAIQSTKCNEVSVTTAVTETIKINICTSLNTQTNTGNSSPVTNYHITSNTSAAAENIKTTQCTSLITQTVIQSSIVSTAEIPVTTMTSVTTSVQQMNLTNPDSEIISTYFNEVNILNNMPYKLQYSGINASLIGNKLQTVHIKTLDSESGIEYVVNADIYNVNVENSKNLIALKYNGSSELYLYYPILDDKAILNCIEFSTHYDNPEISYSSCRSILTNTNKISHFLKDGFIEGYNPVTSEYVSMNVKFYKIMAVSTDAAIAVQYENDSEYHIFVNNNYAPEEIWQFSGDLNILGEMVVNGLYVNGEFYAPDIDLIRYFIKFFGSASVCDDDVKPCKYRIDLDIPLLARYNISFCFDESGYIYTNITGKYAVYYCGNTAEMYISTLKYHYNIPSSN